MEEQMDTNQRSNGRNKTNEMKKKKAHKNQRAVTYKRNERKPRDRTNVDTIIKEQQQRQQAKNKPNSRMK